MRVNEKKDAEIFPTIHGGSGAEKGRRSSDKVGKASDARLEEKIGSIVKVGKAKYGTSRC